MADQAIPLPRILRMKLTRPQLGSDLVSRPRLLEQLNLGLTQPFILVSAPAGFGKTTLICNWLQSNPLPAAWLSLDDSDSDLVVFCNYLIAAIQTVFPNACPITLSLLRGPRLLAPALIGTTLANEIVELPQDF